MVVTAQGAVRDRVPLAARRMRGQRELGAEPRPQWHVPNQRAIEPGRAVQCDGVGQPVGKECHGGYQTRRGGAARLNGSVDGTHVNAQLIGTNSPGVCSFEADFFPDGTAGQGSYGCNDGETGSFTTARAK